MTVLGVVPVLDFELTSGDDRILELTAKDNDGVVVDITAARIIWGLYVSRLGGAAALITKDSINGNAEVEITDAVNGVFQVKLDPADSDALMEAALYHECQIIDATSNKQTVVRGTVNLRNDRIET